MAADTDSDSDSDSLEVDVDDFDDLPTTDIETDLHVHFGMAGSFPLRLVDMFFATDGLHLVEYSYITPMFGLGAKKHHREAGAMQEVYDVHGIDEVLFQGDNVFWLNYGAIDRIVFHRGGRFGRPKITVYPVDESARSHALRLHDCDDPDELAADLRAVAQGRPFTVEVKSGSGFSPGENLKRFFN